MMVLTFRKSERGCLNEGTRFSQYPAEGGLKVAKNKQISLKAAKDEQAQAGAMYTLGKDHAFEWISTHPNASIEELIDELKKAKSKWRINSHLFDSTVQKIANRVMFVMDKPLFTDRSG
jgi:ABC-type nitrate/sulfonate/bicarbonate transport system ATPase subunit